MKRFVKVLAIMLCFSMFAPSIMTNIGVETVEAKVKPPKLSKSKLEIAQGNSTTIKLNNVSSADSKSIKWSSNNKSIATVNKGKIKAIAPGNAVITAKYKKKTYKCKITVKKLGIEYIESEIIGDDGICYIVKYTNKCDYDVLLTITRKTYDKHGYVTFNSESRFTCPKDGSIYFYYNKFSEKQTISDVKQTKAKYGDFSKYVKTNSQITDHQLDITFENISNKDVETKFFVLLYDENNNIVDFRSYYYVYVPKGETAIKTVKDISSKSVRAEVLLIQS